MEGEEGKISVWVRREEKLVSGLSKRTSCTDVVKVLLEAQDAQRDPSYCIVEKWRCFERTLSSKTKILRLWFAWGEEQRNVKFVLVKSEGSLASHGARSAEARVVPSRHRPRVTEGAEGGVPPEKHRRVVRKAFRKLEKINQKRAQRDVASSAEERTETLVRVVIGQNHTVRQQLQRITQLDADIAACEAKVHADRVGRHGVNYVQDTYSRGAARAPRRGGDEADFEEYVRQCEQVVGLQEELWEKEALVDVSAARVQQELNHRRMQRRRKDTEADGADDAASENQLFWEEDRIRTQLEVCRFMGVFSLSFYVDTHTATAIHHILLQGPSDYPAQVVVVSS
ncbi:ras association domain-containing protein 10 isoform 2-T2 [Spinachia spinachia]